MRALRLAFLIVLLGSVTAFAALRFPVLTGRVVDDAYILSQSTIQSLDQILADYERGTTNQVVVVTLASLQGTTIEDYGYQLGRHWQIGQKGKDNGVLLIVAPKERKVRIEVGYGLEPLLTDAISSAIVNGIILPSFRAGHMEQGIIEGTQAIVSVLGGKSLPAQQQPAEEQMSGAQALFLLIFFFLFFGFAIRHPFLAAWLLSSNSSRFGSSRMGGYSGFSGGGGSFGGGGASGSW